MKLRDVKAFLETLTEEQLEQSAVIMGDQDSGFSGGPVGISPFDEDHWYSEDGSFPKSSLNEQDWEEYLEYYREEARVVFTAGSVFFHLNDLEK